MSREIDAVIDAFAAEISLLGTDYWLAEDETQGFPLAPSSSDPVANFIIRPRAVSSTEAIEAKLGHRFPPTYRSLVTRYEFGPFEAGKLMLFGSVERTEMFDLPYALFKDDAIYTATSRAGFVQFGHPYWYNYDPVCFDTTHRSSSGECPIIQVDHEEILCHDRIRVLGKLFSSFREYAEGIVDGKAVSKYLAVRAAKLRPESPA
jgi:hypothetical protein